MVASPVIILLMGFSMMNHPACCESLREWAKKEEPRDQDDEDEEEAPG